MSLIKLFLAGKNLIIPGYRESLISDIQAGDMKIAKHFYSADCTTVLQGYTVAKELVKSIS
jgi:hypothetical protein